MSLKTVIAAPFRGRARRTLAEGEFVVALSLDRDWFSPDQASRAVDLAVSAGLIQREGDGLVPTFEPDDVTVPTDFRPDASLLVDRSPFEQVLAELAADGVEKRAAVAGINRLQADLDVTIDAAAILFARRRGLDVGEAARHARAGLVNG